MMKLQLESQKEAIRLEKEAAEAPEKEALDFYRQLEEEENKKKVWMNLDTNNLLSNILKLDSLFILRSKAHHKN